MYLDRFLSGKDRQDLFHNKPAIFIPIPTSLASAEFINEKFHAGMLMKREEVCWSDPSELFSKYQESLEKFKSPLRNLKILMDPYPKLKEVFVNMARIDMEPSTFHLAQLVQHITTVYSQSEKDVLDDVLFLFSKIGLDLSKIEEKEAGVMTPMAQKATINLPKVMELLKESEVFPTKRGQWVSIKDKPMIANSEELEKVFGDLEKHKYHLLKLETKSSLSTRNKNKRGEGIYLLV
ncbi:unnamed protein product [Lymnaea stagnalis]|uniref:Uncharacterized protein n=1 Tax=Lymnaea stagnalis TaxID=6523 RepID=A0AAV2ICZ0_LYMST